MEALFFAFVAIVLFVFVCVGGIIAYIKYVRKEEEPKRHTEGGATKPSEFSTYNDEPDNLIAQ